MGFSEQRDGEPQINKTLMGQDNWETGPVDPAKKFIESQEQLGSSDISALLEEKGIDKATRTKILDQADSIAEMYSLPKAMIVAFSQIDPNIGGSEGIGWQINEDKTVSFSIYGDELVQIVDLGDKKFTFINEHGNRITLDLEDLTNSVSASLEGYTDSGKRLLYRKHGGTKYTTQSYMSHKTGSQGSIDKKTSSDIVLSDGESIQLSSDLFNRLSINDILKNKPKEIVLDYSSCSRSSYKGIVRAYWDGSTYIALNGSRKGERPYIRNGLKIKNVSGSEETISDEINSPLDSQRKVLDLGKKYIFAEATTPRIDRMIQSEQGPLRVDYSLTKYVSRGIVLGYRNDDSKTYMDSEGKRIKVYDSILIENLQPKNVSSNQQKIEEIDEKEVEKERKENLIRGSSYGFDRLYPTFTGENSKDYKEYFNLFSKNTLTIHSRPSQTYLFEENGQQMINLTFDDRGLNESFNKDIRIPVEEKRFENGEIDSPSFIESMKTVIDSIVKTHFSEKTSEGESNEIEKSSSPKTELPAETPSSNEKNPSIEKDLCWGSVEVDSFMYGITGVEASHSSDPLVVNLSGASTAVGVYQHVRTERRTKIIAYGKKENIQLVGEGTEEWNRALETINKTRTKNKLKNYFHTHPNDQARIITYLTNMDFQQGYMQNYLDETIVKEAKTLKKYTYEGEYSNAELMALIHYLGHPNATIYLSQGYDALPDDAKSDNMLPMNYLHTFAESYNELASQDISVRESIHYGYEERQLDV